jgi:uncharacterized membrane protein
MNNEPVATLGAAVLAVIVAGIALLPTFGFDVSPAQQAALIAFVSSVITLVTIWQRSKVVPTDKANAQIERVAKQDSTFNQAAINELKF